MLAINEHIRNHHNSHADLGFSHFWKCSFHIWNGLDDRFNYNLLLTAILPFWKQNLRSRSLYVLSRPKNEVNKELKLYNQNTNEQWIMTFKLVCWQIRFDIHYNAMHISNSVSFWWFPFSRDLFIDLLFAKTHKNGNEKAFLFLRTELICVV